MHAKLLKYGLSRFGIICFTVVRKSRFCACLLTFQIPETYYAAFQVLSVSEKSVSLLVFVNFYGYIPDFKPTNSHLKIILPVLLNFIR